MDSTIALEFRNAPWTIASAGIDATPRCESSNSLPRPRRESSTALTADEPMSRPTTDLDPKLGSANRTLICLRCVLGATVGGPLGLAVLAPGRGAEHLVLVGDAKREGEQDLPLGIQAARAPRLDAIDGERREARLPRQLRLAQHQGLAELLDVVARHPTPLRRAPRWPGAAHVTVSAGIGEWLRGLERSGSRLTACSRAGKRSAREIPSRPRAGR